MKIKNLSKDLLRNLVPKKAEVSLKSIYTLIGEGLIVVIDALKSLKQ